ncbi:hypothetical protein [Pseudoduganella sp. OTU4001]|uniref:hypothetical protein n=1 Tax=Pseudoduganella sp. OTU4001 TaxID=3043854 RepID=UPI00313E61F0
MTKNQPNPAAATRHLPNPPTGRGLDVLEMLAAGYLLLPVFVFVLGWLKLPYALPLAGAMLPACLLVWRARQRNSAGQPGFSKAELAGVAALTVLWVSLSGLTDGFFLNRDWTTRMSLLRDLVVGSWPASYGQQEGADLILRVPLGYYMVPALAGKLSSLHGARVMLWIWTALGTALFLYLVVGARPERQRGAWRTALLIAVFFSGMDIVGWLMLDRPALGIGRHIEWWLGWGQLSSNSTQLFWVPNHCLPGWLAAVIAWRHRQHGLAAIPAALILLGVIFWAPLVAMGLLPMLLWCVWQRQGWQGLAKESLSLPLWALLPVTLVIWRFFTMGVRPIEGGTQELLMQVVGFVLLSLVEWVLLAWAVMRGGERPALLVIGLLELVVLPWMSYGPGNDLLMRGSIPALTILMLCTIDAWHTALPLRRTIITLLLLVGSVTPLLEIQRALQPGDRYLHEHEDFVQVNGKPWHYLAPLSRPDVRALVKQPQAMPRQ